MVYGRYIADIRWYNKLVHGVYKPTNITGGAPSCRIFHEINQLLGYPGSHLKEGVHLGTIFSVEVPWLSVARDQ